MFSSHLKIAIRAILRNKFFSLLNICGLAVGLAGALLMLMYVVDELQFDRFHDKADRIYRMNLSGNWGGDEARGSGSPPPLAQAMLEEFPEVEVVTRIYAPGDLVVRYGETAFTESQILGADSTFFEVFTFPLLEGDEQTALAKPNAVVLTRRAARKYFGKQPALGEILLVGDGQTPFSVAGVVADPPGNSHFDFDMLASMPSFARVKQFDWSWIWLQMVTYVVLEQGASATEIDAKMPALVEKHGKSVIERFSGMSFQEFESSGGRWSFAPQLLTRIRLYSAQVGNRLGEIGDINTVYLLSVVGLLLVVIACMNFTNLATARSAQRAREVGVRKVVGSQKGHLVAQFLTESVILAAIATVLAFGLVELFGKAFYSISGKATDFNLFSNGWLVVAVFGLPLLVGILAGSYPAFYLTALKPVEVLKGRLSPQGGATLRSLLVSGQFAISIALIVCTLLVNQQLQFLRDKDMGFDQENVIVVSNTERLGDRERALKTALLNHPEIASASFCSGLPTTGSFGDFYEPEAASVENFSLSSVKGDGDFLQTLGIELADGRSFSKTFSTDTQGVLLNQAAVDFLGWQGPVGKTLVYPGHNNQELHVIGVVKDFHFFSVQQKITPFAIFLFESDTYTLSTNYLAVRVQPGDLAATLDLIKAEWRALGPAAPFDYTFLDQELGEQLRQEARLRTVFTLFSSLAVFVACLGLLGLAAFAAERRTKEIGVRKVLGASVASVVTLLSREFARLVLLANLLAWPLAYLVMSSWLDDFAYRIDIDVWSFVLAGGLALAVALLTVSLQALKAAVMNPVKSLRFE